MDPRVLHPVHSPERNYKWKDKLNSLTGHLDCRFLEWTGWYNQDILQRLLGHYRLYQVLKLQTAQVIIFPHHYLYSQLQGFAWV